MNPTHNLHCYLVVILIHIYPHRTWMNQLTPTVGNVKGVGMPGSTGIFHGHRMLILVVRLVWCIIHSGRFSVEWI